MTPDSSTPDEAPNPPKMIYPIISVLVLVAVSIYIFVIVRDQTSDVTPSANPRAFDEIRIVEPNPKAGINRFLSFSWAYELQPGGKYRVDIRNVTTGELIVDDFELAENTWSPEPDLLDRLDDKIELTVQAWSPDFAEMITEVTREFEIDGKGR